MLIRYAAAAALILSALGAPALAADAPEAQADHMDATKNATSAKEDPKARKVCHMETPTGSIFSKRVCTTAADNEQAQASARDALDRAQRQGGGTQAP